MPEEDRGLTSQIGPVEIDWPRTIGYYGGIMLATGFELIELPLALFIAAVPFFRMLNAPQASRPVRFLSQFLEGASKPVGGSAEATVRLTTSSSDSQPGRPGFWQEARQLRARWRKHEAGSTSEMPGV